MSKVYKTTKKDFEEFEAECRKWIDFFGMKDWDFFFYHEDPVWTKDCRAACSTDYCGKLASLFLSPEWSARPIKNEVKKVAFHEVCETLTSQLVALAESRFVCQDEINVANHYIIRVLENTIFEGREQGQ